MPDYYVQSFLNSATKNLYTVSTTTTILQLKQAISTATGVTTTIMQLYYDNIEMVNTATIGFYNVANSGTIYSSNNISSTSTWTKQQRQILKLDLAQLRRKAAGVTTATFYRTRNAYILAELPTTFVNNTTTFNNTNSGGLIVGRPWGGIPSSGLVVWADASYPTSYSGTGTTWYDLASPSNDITLVASPTYSSNNGGYFTFNGSTQYGTIAGSVMSATSYTKCVWFYLNSTFDNNLISSDTGQHYMFFNNTNRLYSGHTGWTGFPTTYPSAATFSNSTWYHAALTFNTTTGMVLYINGVQDSTYTAQKTGLSGDGSARIATYGNPGNLLNGRLSQVLIYDRSLTSEEVLGIYQSSKTRYGY